MRFSCTAMLLLLGLGLVSCSRDDADYRAHDAARQAGREAYRASQEVKHGAKAAAQDLRNASKEFRDGWSEAKHNDRNRPDK